MTTREALPATIDARRLDQRAARLGRRRLHATERRRSRAGDLGRAGRRLGDDRLELDDEHQRRGDQDGGDDQERAAGDRERRPGSVPSRVRSGPFTIGRNVAARTSARTTGTTTSGSLDDHGDHEPHERGTDEQPPAPLGHPVEPTRDETGRGVPVGSRSGSMTAMSAPATAVMNATTGTATNSPTIPAIVAPAGRAMRTTAGWMWTVLP